MNVADSQQGEVRPEVAEVLTSLGIDPRGIVSRSTFRRRAPQRAARGRSPFCSKCGEPRDRGPKQAYCKKCHAEHARATRPKHSELDPEARKRANCRRMTSMLITRGKMERLPCACGAVDVTIVHLNFDDPWAVEFKCKACRTGVPAAPAVAA